MHTSGLGGGGGGGGPPDYRGGAVEGGGGGGGEYSYIYREALSKRGTFLGFMYQKSPAKPPPLISPPFSGKVS